MKTRYLHVTRHFKTESPAQAIWEYTDQEVYDYSLSSEHPDYTIRKATPQEIRAHKRLMRDNTSYFLNRNMQNAWFPQHVDAMTTHSHKR